MADKVEEPIVRLLDELRVTTRWMFVTLISFLAAMMNKEALELAGVKIPRTHASLLIFVVLTAVTFQALRLFHLVASHGKQEFLPKEIEALHRHPWSLNPFSERPSWLSPIADSMGYALLVAMWWTGAYTGLYLFEESSAELRSWSLIVFLVYSGLGLVLLPQLTQLVWVVGSKKWLSGTKIFLAVISVLICSHAFGDQLP